MASKDIVIKNGVLRNIRETLLFWYDRYARDLPWRRTRDPYAILVSEVMLQQTRVDTVIPYYKRFLAAFPDVFALAAADETTLLKYWEGLGYYRRARNLQKAARAVVEKYDGVFPMSVAKLLELPGVGQYTAGAVASIAFGFPTPAVDGNVLRVYSRLFGVMDSIDETATKQRIETAAQKLVDPQRPGAFNQAVMELGATICVKQNPQCTRCYLRDSCFAFTHQLQHELPRRTPKKKPPQRHGIAFWIEDDAENVLLAKRPAAAMLGGMWELPGRLLALDESPDGPLKAVLRMTAPSLSSSDVLPFAGVKHAYSHFTLHLKGYRLKAEKTLAVALPKAIQTVLPMDEAQWVARDKLAGFPIHQAHHKLIAAMDKRSDTPTLFDE